MANIKISELNELTQATRSNNDYVPIVDTSANETKKIAVESLIPSNVTLVAVSSTEPSTCYTGDQYFNTTTNLIYTAIETNVWGTTGEQAKIGITYIVFGTQTAYAYNGTTLISVGGGASGGGETLPVGSEIDYTGTAQDIPDGWEEVESEWTYVGTITGQTNLDLPTSWKELNCIFLYAGDTTKASTFNILKEYTQSPVSATVFGIPSIPSGGSTGNSQGYMGAIKYVPSTNKITIEYAPGVTSTSKLYVYYK